MPSWNKVKLLDLYYPRNARRLYTDSGTGANQDLSIFEAYLPSGYFMIGHYAQRNHDRQVNRPIPMVRPLQSDAIVTPDYFYQLYTDRGTGGRQDLSLWQPITRNNRYVCLGTVASLNYSAPYGLSMPACGKIWWSKEFWDIGSGMTGEVEVGKTCPCGQWRVFTTGVLAILLPIIAILNLSPITPWQ